jgi:hypothetical protein
LKVLGDLVEDSLNEDQFFSVARDILKVVYDIAINDGRTMTLRALAVSVFRGCFDIMEIVKDEHGPEVKAFADEVLSAWSPFFLQVMKIAFPSRATSGTPGLGHGEPENWKGTVALKLQVVKTLMKIRAVFPQLLLPQSPVLFSATWEELSLLQSAFQEIYIDNEEAQGRLVDADGLPYTLDFLILEELDFLQSCLRAPPVQKELEAALQANGGIQTTPWIFDVMKLAVSYAQILSEDEGLWDIDINLFLAEETSATANYTARTACGDLLIKLGEWLHQGAVEGLLTYTKALFASPVSTWRTKEASLFLLTQLMTDFLDVDKSIPVELASAYLEFIDFALNNGEPFLRARGYLVAGIFAESLKAEAFPSLALLDRSLKAIKDDESDVVKVACIRSLQNYIKAPGSIPVDRQIPIIVAISEYLEARDMSELEDSDDLVLTLIESLRAAIQLDPRISISQGSGVLDLLFLMAKHTAANFTVSMLVNETFEEIVSSLSSMGPEAYTALCEKVLPSLTGTFDVGNMTEDNPLTTVSICSHV